MAIVSRPIHTNSPNKGRVAFQPSSNVNHSFVSGASLAGSPPADAWPTMPSQRPSAPPMQQSRHPSVSTPVVAPHPRHSAAPPSSDRNGIGHLDQRRMAPSLSQDTASKRSTRSSVDGSTATTESWRKHGKRFRANLVLEDDAQGENVFTLSESCTIERYYRVADRVLEQFLSSDISNRNGMIESYLIGNRLFKFLSIVLPTHNDYFSSEEHLSSLRMKSQNQLIELLEYMEELEVIIDEMEYNHYLMTNTNRQQQQQLKQSSGHMTDETADTSRSMSEQDTSDETAGNDPAARLPSDTTAPPTSSHVGSDDSFAILEDIGDNPSIAKHVKNQLKRGGHSQSPHEFAQRVAAVVAASSSDLHDVPESASLTMRSISSANSFSKNPISRSATDSPVVKPPPISPRKSAVSTRNKESVTSLGSDHQSEISWGNSTFVPDPFANDFEAQSANHINLLVEDDEFDPFGVVPKEATCKSRAPTQKEKIRLSLPSLNTNKKSQSRPVEKHQPRTLDAKLQRSTAATKRRSMGDAASAHADSGVYSGFSSDVFHALEDQSGTTVPSSWAAMGGQPQQNQPEPTAPPTTVKSKIEQRLESAAQREASILSRRRQKQHDPYNQFTGWEDSSMLDGDEPTLLTERRLMHQFRGCIRCLVD